MKHKTLKEIYLYSMLLLMALILSMQLFYFSAMSSYTKKGTLEVMSFISTQLTNKIQKEIFLLKGTAEALSFDAYISRFLLEENPANRYQDPVNIYKQMRSLLKEDSSLTTILIYDSLGHRYEYGEAFSAAVCRKLYESVQKQEPPSYSLQIIEDDTYLVAYIPIYSTRSFPLEQIGWAVLLSRCDYIQNYLDSYSGMSGLSVALANKRHQILLSNREELLYTDFTSLTKKKKSQIALSEQTLFPSDIQLTILQDNSKLIPYQSLFIKSTFLLIVVLIVISVLISRSINHMIFLPINYIISVLDSLGSQGAKGRLIFQPHIYQSLQIVKLAQTINQMLARIDDFSHRAFLNQQRLYESALKEAKYKTYLLRKQIDAHFIFNTLNSIKILSDRYQAEDIAQMTEGLGNIMRYAYLPTDYINLFDEFQILEQYVYIMNVRYDHCFFVEYEVEDILCNYRILRQLLQPLLENCMTHAPLSSGNPLSITVCAQILPEERLRISVTDNGIGISPEKLADIRSQLNDNKEHYDTKGISLVNINQRLQLYYGTPFHLTIESVQGEYTCVSFLIPLQPDTP
ncbi:MAG: histidine kinase [Lachnospiraceae bacterium]|jgi:two-component system sensor histidine kinase YesM|nr:histidine kinase [Lachnospiraceae bacterium]